MKKCIAYLVAAVLVFSVFVPQSFGFFFSKHEKVTAVDGVVRLAVDEIGDGAAHHFLFRDGDVEVKFFVLRSTDGVIRAAFDACDVCYHARKGYTQEGEFMLCRNCGRKFHANRINVVKGGCNPAPLRRVVEGEYLVLKAGDIAAGARYF